MSTPILLDCDPGIDDALAIAFAAGHPDIELAGITTVAGNVGVGQTTANALAVSEFAGAPSVPVTRGSAAPLLRAARDARDVHGDSGLGGAVLPPPSRDAEPGHAVDYLIETIAASPGEITLVATGPLTNIALAVRREPRLPGWVRDFVIMGGSAGRGNVTPAAEFNIWSDPEAAAITFGAGWTVRMIGLDVTLQALATPPVRARMSEFGTLGDTLLLPALAQYHDSAAGGDPAVHDVCAVASVAEPSVFGYTPARVEVETAGRLTSGMTVTSFTGSGPGTGSGSGSGSGPNAEVATSIDSGAFWDLVLKTYSGLASSMSR
ncbi:MAG: nucleoside hydrolase [Streptosporangiales bacterium]|nr:nucleoside hydrolase [Streptosporangiales bacterium]